MSFDWNERTFSEFQTTKKSLIWISCGLKSTKLYQIKLNKILCIEVEHCAQLELSTIFSGWYKMLIGKNKVKLFKSHTEFDLTYDDECMRWMRANMQHNNILLIYFWKTFIREIFHGVQTFGVLSLSVFILRINM